MSVPGFKVYIGGMEEAFCELDSELLMREPSLLVWVAQCVHDVTVHYGHVQQEKERPSPPSHCAVAKAIVGEELVCMVYTTHELVIYTPRWLVASGLSHGLLVLT